MGKNAIIFDLDGTLWDTLYQTFLAYNYVLKKYNYPSVSLEKVHDNFGNNRNQSIKLLFPTLTLDIANKILDEVNDEIINILNESSGKIYNGVNETLNLLSKKYELYIVSNCSYKSYIESFLKIDNFDKYFKDYIAASGLSISKADAIKKMINDNQIKKAIYVGDTDKDMLAAKEAQVPFIQCLYGFGKDLNCDYKINDISEIYKYVNEIFSNN